MEQTIYLQTSDTDSEVIAENEVTLLVQNNFIPEIDHIKIAVNQEGVIIERWDQANGRYVNSYCVLFANDFNGPKGEALDDEVEIEDEPEDE